MSILLITHDLGVVAQSADHVDVMYAGKIIETASVDELFKNPLHPYTLGLFKALPRMGENKKRLDAIPGQVPNPTRFPTGCRFHPRCPSCKGDEKCINEQPPFLEHRPGHFAACWHIS